MVNSPHPQESRTSPAKADSVGSGVSGPSRNGRPPLERLWRAVRLHRLRLVRLPSTPHRIALGVALGMLIGSIPLIPSQMLLAGAVAWLLRASPTAAIVTTLYSNPVTCGPLYVLFFAIGSFLLPDMHVALPDDLANLGSLLSMGWDVYLVLCTGGVVFGAITGVLAYVAAHRMVASYQLRRMRWRSRDRNAPPVVAGCTPSEEGDGCEEDNAENGGQDADNRKGRPDVLH
ncbi:MAG TPA: DUF2062 domain-containing protein [Nitratidesulfovibrio sp.]|nr:DUF2062 domain-containing protein [Nitratidesulfovibrio sp.]